MILGQVWPCGTVMGIMIDITCRIYFLSNIELKLRNAIPVYVVFDETIRL